MREPEEQGRYTHVRGNWAYLASEPPGEPGRLLERVDIRHKRQKVPLVSRKRSSGVLTKPNEFTGPTEITATSSGV